MEFRIALSVFSLLNVVFWALLAWVWAIRPTWAERLPLNLGTDPRFKASVPTWARLASAVAAFWVVAAVIYLTQNGTNRVAYVALVVVAAIFLILGLGAAARVYTVLQTPKSGMTFTRQKKAS